MILVNLLGLDLKGSRHEMTHKATQQSNMTRTIIGPGPGLGPNRVKETRL